MTTKEFVAKVTDSASSYPNGTFSVKGKIHTCVNPYSYHIVRKYRNLYGEMDGLFVDGMTMCWWLRLLWGKKIPRLSFDMSGMAVDLFARLNHTDSKETIFFLGAKQEEVERSVEQIKASFPNIKVAGSRNGYFSNDNERNEIIGNLVSLNPSFVIVGMGSPLQEQFVLDLKHAGYKGIAFTCGGFLHQTANRINYYPDWVNHYNLRAFYRLTHEKGLAKRLFDVLIGFPMRFVLDTILNK